MSDVSEHDSDSDTEILQTKTKNQPQNKEEENDKKDVSSITTGAPSTVQQQGVFVCVCARFFI